MSEGTLTSGSTLTLKQPFLGNTEALKQKISQFSSYKVFLKSVTLCYTERRLQIYVVLCGELLSSRNTLKIYMYE